MEVELPELGREELVRLRRAPSRAGLAGALAAIGLLLLGTLGAELFLTRASLLLFLASACVYLFGWRHLRAVAFPLAIVALSIPIPAILMTRITLPLQFAASAAAETTLSTIGIPVLREGNVLVLSGAGVGGECEVQACNERTRGGEGRRRGFTFRATCAKRKRPFAKRQAGPPSRPARRRV